MSAQGQKGTKGLTFLVMGYKCNQSLSLGRLRSPSALRREVEFCSLLLTSMCSGRLTQEQSNTGQEQPYGAP